MNNIEIYYFSGTGNSLHIARELKKRIPRVTLIPFLSLLTRKIKTTGSETVGFIVPQYASSAPAIVMKLLKKLDVTPAKYIFAIATRGGTGCRVFIDINRILKKQGRHLDSYFVLTMPGGSAPLVKDFFKNITEEKIVKLEAEAQARLDTIQEIILNREINRNEDLGPSEPPPDILKPIAPVLIFLAPVLIPFAKKVEGGFHFYFDSKCNGCGICEQICLSKKIKMNNGKPLWQNEIQCYGCFACLNYCPEQAIQIKSKWYFKFYTEITGRYHHPAITVKDIAAQKWWSE